MTPEERRARIAVLELARRWHDAGIAALRNPLDGLSAYNVAAAKLHDAVHHLIELETANP